MKKKHVLAFLKSRKRGVYTMLAEMYADVVTSMAITMAIEVIKEDLERSLARLWNYTTTVLVKLSCVLSERAS